MRLQWKNPKIDGYPSTKTAQCFIKVLNSIQLAYWHNDVKEWDNAIYGWLPRIYDDESSYPAEVIAWAYVPEELLFAFDEFIPCSAYRKDCYIPEEDRCFGTKEREICYCNGNKKECNFY